MNTKINYGIILLGLMLLLCANVVRGQEQPGRRARADQLYRDMEYADAARFYVQLVDRKKPHPADMVRLAHCYYHLKQYDLAENWYALLVQMGNTEGEVLTNYADVLKQQGKYAEARKQYEQYIDLYGRQAVMLQALAGADSALVWMERPTDHKIRAEAAVNTPVAEFGAYPAKQGGLYAGEQDTRIGRDGIPGRSYLRLYRAEQNQDGTMANPVLLSEPFNTSLYHIGPVAMNGTEDELYITRTYPGQDPERIRVGGDRWRKHNLELKIYKKLGNGWKEEDFAYNNVKAYSVGHATLHTDERTLYFASDMPGGYGGVDIWYSERQPDGTWGLPQNAGNAINTPGDEMFPFIHGNTLYFSSDGHVGMGGLDIFRAERNARSFDKPVNLGFPLNSAADDFAFFVTGDIHGDHTGYLSSNRKNGAGSDDIYSFTYRKPKVTIVLRAQVQDLEKVKLPGAMVTLLSGDREIVAKGRADDDAGATFMLEANTTYVLLGEHKGHYADSLLLQGLNVKADTILHVALNLRPIFRVGDSFVLENIHYDLDKHDIRPDAAKILDGLVATLRDNPTLRIELSSHTDSRGSHRYNEQLSQRRAQSAVDYIVSRGIARERLVAKGYGESRLLNRCSDGVPCSEAEHAANRRTEVQILAY